MRGQPWLTAAGRTLHQFPLLGAATPRIGPELRFVLGPWRWMIVIYRYFPEAHEVRIISVQDGRSARSLTGGR
jgi:hypothetical protein